MPSSSSSPSSPSSSSSSSSSSAVRLLGLNKHYLGQSRPAVRELWLGVAPGECFGLLGINGCGKTTTFRIAAGDLPPTRGKVNIAVAGWARGSAGGGVGYCPQRDSLNPALTVSEHLRLVAAARRSRGGFFSVNERSVSTTKLRIETPTSGTSTVSAATVADAVAVAGLGRFADVRAGHLSGGNKRKLCLAMSLMGLREGGLALLDEPTAGVDPGARDVITETIRGAAVKRKCAVVVTSHSIEDASALCQRVGVMVDGALMCLGSPQHLRTRHGRVLTLTVHLRAPTASSAVSSGDSGDGSAGAHVIDVFDAFVKGLIPGSKRVTAFDGGADNVTSTFAAHTEEEAAAGWRLSSASAMPSSAARRGEGCPIYGARASKRAT